MKEATIIKAIPNPNTVQVSHFIEVYSKKDNWNIYENCSFFIVITAYAQHKIQEDKSILKNTTKKNPKPQAQVTGISVLLYREFSNSYHKRGRKDRFAIINIKWTIHRKHRTKMK